MREELFRKKALERLSSPEQLDLLMQVTNPRGWLALLAFGAILLTALLWSIFGKIPTRVYGQGILIRSGGVHEVVTLVAGRVTEIDVQPGDHIAEGQIVARVAQPELFTEIQTAEAELQMLQLQRSSQSDQQLVASEQKITDQRRKIEDLRSQLDLTSRVISQQEGRVLEIRADVGTIVALGTPLFSIESSNSVLEALFYIAPGDGKKVHAGMNAHVSPSTVKKEEYGLIEAKVKSVSSFPSSSQAMLRVLGNETMVRTLSASGAPFEVHADLMPDAGTESGFRWSSAKGPPVKIYSGTLCTGMVTVREQRPITLLIPYLREKFGV